MDPTDPIQVLTKQIIDGIFAKLEQTAFGQKVFVNTLLKTGNQIADSEIPLFVPIIEKAITDWLNRAPTGTIVTAP